MAAVTEQYFTKTQAAAELGVSYATLDRRVKAGLIPAYQLGREVVFLHADIEKAKQPIPKRIEAQAV
ncbi:MAG TPA: helix-turn-helix domain-containing protein [Terriglobales bacterium]|jgi:excisionase family DNA binding protein|nr:helix-turn-helix domain-containing protein [Terriglobales bacterium]